MASLAQGKSTGRYNSVFLTVFFLSVPAGNVFSGVLFLLQPSQNGAPMDGLAPLAAPVAAADVVKPPLFLLLALLGLVVCGAVMFFFIIVPDVYPFPELCCVP